MYEVVSDFYDAKNNNHLYKTGDEYLVNGYKPTKARVEELAKGKNKYAKVFIKEVKSNPENGESKTPDPENGEGKAEE